MISKRQKRPQAPYIFYLIAVLFLISEVLLIILPPEEDTSFYLSLAGIIIGFLSLGIAFESWHISESSDKKMQDVAEYLFNEKLAILNQHLTVGDANYLIQEFTRRILNDLDAALSVKDWILSKEKLCELSNIVKALKGRAEEALRVYKGTDIGVVSDFVKELDTRGLKLDDSVHTIRKRGRFEATG